MNIKIPWCFATTQLVLLIPFMHLFLQCKPKYTTVLVTRGLASLISKVLGISPCIAKGFHSGLSMISAMGVEEEMTLLFAHLFLGVSAEAFGKLHT